MSDFLKNFRNAQSNRYAGKKNPYDGHYYANQNANDLRSGTDRRANRGVSQSNKPVDPSSQSLFQKIEELLPAVKNLLDTMAGNQDELFELKKRQEENIATIAGSFNEIVNVFCETGNRGESPPPAKKKTAKAPKSAGYSLEDIEKEGMQSAASKKREVIKLMKKLRKKGGTYKEIANFLNEKQIPTFSNNGKWHAQTIHRLCGK